MNLNITNLENRHRHPLPPPFPLKTASHANIMDAHPINNIGIFQLTIDAIWHSSVSTAPHSSYKIQQKLYLAVFPIYQRKWCQNVFSDFVVQCSDFNIHQFSTAPRRCASATSGESKVLVSFSFTVTVNLEGKWNPHLTSCSQHFFRMLSNFCLCSNTDLALKELYGNISEQETAHPDTAFVVTGDFNKANFRTIALNYFQHITINTRGDRVLDHCYSPFRDAYKSLSRPPFGKSDHSSVLLLPAYRQKLKREAPALRTIQCWSDQLDAILQDCFDHVGHIWCTGTCSGQHLMMTEAYSDTETCFIRKCIEDVVPTKTVCIYPNQKTWINIDVRAALSARTSAFKSGNTDDQKQASYDLRKSIKAAKRQYKN